MWEFFYSITKLYLLLYNLYNTIFKLSFQLCWHKPVLQMFYPGQNPAFTLTLPLWYNGSLYQQIETKGTVLYFNSSSHIYFHCNENGCWFFFFFFFYKSQYLHLSENESHVLIKAWMCYHIWCVWKPLQKKKKKNHVSSALIQLARGTMGWIEDNRTVCSKKKMSLLFLAS